MIARVRRLVVGLVVSTLLLSGCAAASGRTDDGRPIVTASFYPLAWLAGQIGGRQVQVLSLTSPGIEPHDLELSIRQLLDVSRAGLVVYERGFQASVDDAVDQNAEGEVLDAATIVGLVQRDGQTDPHFWQDPTRMAVLAERVGASLERLDPTHAADFERRTHSIVGALHRLDRAYTEGLSSCRTDTVVVTHDAFGYLDRYGLRIRSIVGLSPDAEPTPAGMSRLKDLIDSDGITTVFAERLASRQSADALAREAGVRVAVLDPIEGLSDTTAHENYLSLMRSNLTALRKANGC